MKSHSFYQDESVPISQLTHMSQIYSHQRGTHPINIIQTKETSSLSVVLDLFVVSEMLNGQQSIAYYKRFSSSLSHCFRDYDREIFAFFCLINQIEICFRLNKKTELWRQKEGMCVFFFLLVHVYNFYYFIFLKLKTTEYFFSHTHTETHTRKKRGEKAVTRIYHNGFIMYSRPLYSFCLLQFFVSLNFALLMIHRMFKLVP